MYYLNKRKKIIGYYVPNIDGFNNNPKDVFTLTPDKHQLLPLFNMFSLDSKCELRMIDNKGNGVVDMINTDNYKKGLNNKQLKVNSGGLIAEPVVMFLNFTGKTVTMQDQYGNTTCLLPLVVPSKTEDIFYASTGKTSSEIFEEYKNYIVVLSITSVLTEATYKKVYGVDDYMSKFLDNENNRVDRHYTWEMYNLIKSNPAKNSDKYSNLKVVHIATVTPDDFYKASVDNCDICLPEFRVSLSFNSPADMAPNPYLGLSQIDKETVDFLRDKKHAYIYIEDISGTVKPRYTKIFGKAVRIPVYSSGTIDRPLLKLKLIGDNRVQSYTLKEMNELPFIYETEEEAERELNRTVIVEERRSEERHSRDVELQEISIAKLKADYEHKLKLSEQELEKITTKLRYEKELVDKKNRLEDTKFKYDERSYYRDETLETLKTTAALAGVVVTLGVLYNKIYS